MGEFVKVAHTSDIPPGTFKAFNIRRTRFVLCNHEGKLYAIADECTHDGAPIHTGRLFGTVMMCPRHGAKFDIRDGSVQAPPAVVPLETYEVKIENDEISVRLD